MARRGSGGLAATVICLSGAAPALAEPAEALPPAAPAVASDDEMLRGLLARLWYATELAPGRPVALRLVDGLSLNAVAASRAISISTGYLRWTREFAPAERERILARTLAHELAHLALGHGFVHSPQDELQAEALGIYYFELAGFDCRWWVEYVRSADETEGRRGWPPLRVVLEHDVQACARARGLLGRDTPDEAGRP